jgi:hypothetical protein
LKRKSYRRTAGLGAAWIAALALVLNVLLSSALLASISPAAFAAGHELCLNSPDPAAAVDDASKTTGKSVMHCPICIGNHAPGVPPTTAVFTVSRVAVAIAQELTASADVVERLAGYDHRARAPPSLS